MSMMGDLLFNLFGSTFCSVQMYQYWAELAVWEAFLNEHTDITAIMELGTGDGAFSTFLLLQALNRDMEFHTMDREHPSMLDTPVGQRLRLDEYFTRCDYLRETRTVIAFMERFHPMLLYCDGGNKSRDMNHFVPFLQSGSYVAVHDWKVEIQPEDITVLDNVLEPVFVAESTSLCPHLTRFWRKK